MSQYDFTKDSISSFLLATQIAQAEISKELVSIDFYSPNLSMTFNGELTQGEQDILSALVLAHDSSGGGFFDPVHVVMESIPGNLTSEKWYQDIDENNNVSNLSKEIVHVWNGGKEERRITKLYFKCGIMASEEVVDLFYDKNTKKALEKKVS